MRHILFFPSLPVKSYKIHIFTSSSSFTSILKKLKLSFHLVNFRTSADQGQSKSPLSPLSPLSHVDGNATQAAPVLLGLGNVTLETERVFSEIYAGGWRELTNLSLHLSILFHHQFFRARTRVRQVRHSLQDRARGQHGQVFLNCYIM